MGLLDSSKEHAFIVALLEEQVRYLKSEVARMNDEHTRQRDSWDAQRMELIDTICLSRGIPSPFEQRQDAERSAQDSSVQPVNTAGRLSMQQVAIKMQNESRARRNQRLLEQQARAALAANEAGKQAIP